MGSKLAYLARVGLRAHFECLSVTALIKFVMGSLFQHPTGQVVYMHDLYYACEVLKQVHCCPGKIK